MGVLPALTRSIDAKDAYTRGHSQRVAELSRDLARRIGLTDEQCERVYLSGLLHDVGKIGVPEAVLCKPGKLTAEERRKLQSDLNKTSRDIHTEKHDAEVRTPAPRDPGVNARQVRQQERIGQGIKSGELTGKEAVRLEREERAVRVEERAYKADGKLTPAERKDLHQDLNKVSSDIYKQKHDGQTRPVTPPATTPSN
jgi:polyhydroxyalkanoate synthesis regulator phasin